MAQIGFLRFLKSGFLYLFLTLLIAGATVPARPATACQDPAGAQAQLGPLPRPTVEAAQSRSADDLPTKAVRAAAIQDAVSRLRSDFSLPPDLPTAHEEAIILSIAAQECGGHGFDNTIVSRDWGRGVMQITYPDDYVGAGNPGTCGPGTDCDLCRQGGQLWRLCRQSPSHCAGYYAIRAQALDACAAFYANTQAGIDRNIRDGLYVLQDKHGFGYPANLQAVDLGAGLQVQPAELRWMLVAERYGPYYAHQGPLFYVREIGKLLAYELQDHYGPQQDIHPDLGAKFTSACARRIELKGSSDLQAHDAQGQVTGRVQGEAHEEVPNSLYYDLTSTSRQLLTLLFPSETFRHRVVGNDASDYDLTLTSGCEGLSPFSTESTGASTLQLQAVSIAPGAVHEYVLDWSPGATTAIRRTDADGDGTFEITSTIQMPEASFTYAPPTPRPGQSVTFDATPSFDPDGEIVSYRWSFGDGSVLEGSDVEVHPYPSAGVYYVTLTVRDNHGAIDTASATVTIPARIYLPLVTSRSSH